MANGKEPFMHSYWQMEVAANGIIVHWMIIKWVTTWAKQQIFHQTSKRLRRLPQMEKCKLNRIIIFHKCSVFRITIFFLFNALILLNALNTCTVCIIYLLQSQTWSEREKKIPKKSCIKYKIQKHSHGSCRLQTTWHICIYVIVRFAHRHVHFGGNETAETSRIR